MSDDVEYRLKGLAAVGDGEVKAVVSFVDNEESPPKVETRLYTVEQMEEMLTAAEGNSELVVAGMHLHFNAALERLHALEGDVTGDYRDSLVASKELVEFDSQADLERHMDDLDKAPDVSGAIEVPKVAPYVPF